MSVLLIIAAAAGLGALVAAAGRAGRRKLARARRDLDDLGRERLGL